MFTTDLPNWKNLVDQIGWLKINLLTHKSD